MNTSLRSTKTTNMLDNAFAAMREAQGELAKLRVLREWTDKILQFGDDGTYPLDDLSSCAIDAHELDPDTVQNIMGRVAELAVLPKVDSPPTQPRHPNEPPPGEQPIEALDTFDACEWNGKKPDPRKWITDGQIPCGEPGILNGDGGTGKTTVALQLCDAVSDEQVSNWLGKIIDTHGPVIFYSIEEKKKELHRRVATIRARHQHADIAAGRFHIIADLPAGEAVLAKPDRGLIQPTRTLLRLEKTVEKIKPALIVIENAGDVFIGNENDRAQVSMFVRVMLGGLCAVNDATVMLLQHPSVSGMQDGTGRSGSTAWNNASRWRLNFTFDKDGSGDVRKLKTEKVNYGKPGEIIQLAWDRGIFSRADCVADPIQLGIEADVEAAYLHCLQVKTARFETVSHRTGKNYAPAIFERMREAGTFRRGAFERAQERLLSDGRIEVVRVGSPAKPRYSVRVKPSGSDSGTTCQEGW